MKIKSLFNVSAMFFIYHFSVWAFAETCTEIEARSAQGHVLIPSHRSGYRVIGADRAYIYSAPGETCYSKQLFLVPGDLLNGYLEYNDFMYMLYINPSSGKETTGWIKLSRVKGAGTGIGPGPQAEN
jgi:hypothetical protein